MTVSTAPLLPLNPSFAGHQTFAVRSGWLKKGLDALQNEEAGGPNLFSREDALVTLGVGKNMVQSIRHWLLALRLAEESASARGRSLVPTEMGIRLFGTPEEEGWDSFLEDEATLWLLHWQLGGGGSPAFTWVWTFNRFREYEFTRAELSKSVQEGANASVSRGVSAETVSRDVDCLIHCYAPAERGSLSEDNLECPLQALGLMRPVQTGRYRFQQGEKPTLPTAIFAFALLRFWQERHPEARSLSFYEMAQGEGSPGKVFRLDEESVLPYLDALDALTGGAVRFEEDALTRQAVCRSPLEVEPMALLEAYYRG